METKEEKSKRLKRERDLRYRASKKAGTLADVQIGSQVVTAKEQAQVHAKKLKSAQASIGEQLVKEREARESVTYSDIPGVNAYNVMPSPEPEPLPPIAMPPPVPLARFSVTRNAPPRTPEDEDDEPIIVRKAKPPAPKVTKYPVGTRTVTEKVKKVLPEGMTLVMKRTYQREGKVAHGTEARGGGRQLSIVFPPKLFAKLAELAQGNGVSVGEQVRQFVVDCLEPK